MENYWVSGVNNSGQYGRWAFAELKDVFAMEANFQEKVEFEFNKMIEVTSVKKDVEEPQYGK